MTRTRRLSFPLVLAGAALGGCSEPAAIAPTDAANIKVHNPSPDNKLKDVTLENESQHLKDIGGISK